MSTSTTTTTRCCLLLFLVCLSLHACDARHPGALLDHKKQPENTIFHFNTMSTDEERGAVDHKITVVVVPNVKSFTSPKTVVPEEVSTKGESSQLIEDIDHDDTKESIQYTKKVKANLMKKRKGSITTASSASSSGTAAHVLQSAYHGHKTSTPSHQQQLFSSSSSSSSVSWRVPKRSVQKQPGFNVDYSPPKTHPPSHN